MRVSTNQEEKAAQERRERRMQYASSLPAIKVPPHLLALPHATLGVKRAETSIAYLSPAEAPDRRLKERIYQSELEAMRASENQVGRKVAQMNVRSAWLADQLEQQRQEERALEHRVEQEKRKWLKRRELEAEVEMLRGQLKEAWGAIASGHSLEAEREKQTLEDSEAAQKRKVRHLAKICVQRMQKRSLFRGFNGFREYAEERQRLLRRMRATASRLIRPKQTACFAHWRARWTGAQNREKIKDTTSALADEMERRAALEEEVEMLRVAPRVEAMAIGAEARSATRGCTSAAQPGWLPAALVHLTRAR